MSSTAIACPRASVLGLGVGVMVFPGTALDKFSTKYPRELGTTGDNLGQVVAVLGIPQKPRVNHTCKGGEPGYQTIIAVA